MTKDEALRIALEALENAPIEYDFHGNPMDAEFGKQLDAAITALRQALEQPEQEVSYTDIQMAELIMSDCGHSSDYKPLLDRIAGRLAKYRQALEEPEPEQEPVAWMHPDGKNYKGFKSPLTTFMVNGWTPLYTAPPSKPKEWVSLTDEDITEAFVRMRRGLGKYTKFAQIIEAKLKEKNNG